MPQVWSLVVDRDDSMGTILFYLCLYRCVIKLLYDASQVVVADGLSCVVMWFLDWQQGQNLLRNGSLEHL